MIKNVWKNVIGIIAIFMTLFLIFFFNLKIGFTAFDFTKSNINNPLLLIISIIIISVIISVLMVFLIIFIIIYRKKKKLN